MKTTILDLSQKKTWHELLHEIPDGRCDIYYTPEYYQVYENYGDGLARCFVYQEGEQIMLYPFLLNPISPLGFHFDREYYDIQGAYGYNGIISNTDDQEVYNRFFHVLSQFCQEENIIAEFLRFHPLIQNHLHCENYYQILEDRRTVSLDLTCNMNSIWNDTYSSDNRRMIRKARNRKIRVVKGDPEQMPVFTELYYKTMRHAGAETYYFFDQNYFGDFCSLLGNQSELFFAFYGDKVVGAALTIECGTQAAIHLSCSDREFSNSAVNNLLYHSVIEYYQARGFRSFHIGGGLTNHDQDPLFRFKRGFSRQTNSFFIGKKIHNRNIYSSLVDQWESKYPEKKENLKHILLKYRR